MRAAVIAACLALAAPALADEAEPRPPRRFHLSIGGGGSLLLTGQGDLSRSRVDGFVMIEPGGRWGRFGLVGALRHVTYDPVAEDGLATLGVRYEAAAARPRLTVALHADLGATIGGVAPALGGGVETHFWVWPKKLGPLALVLDATAHLVVDGVAGTRLVIGSATRIALAW